MPVARSLIRAGTRARASRLSERCPCSRQWQKTGRRRYASTTDSAKEGAQKAGESAKKAGETAADSAKAGAKRAGESAKDAGAKVKGSELPWVLGAAAVTTVGTYLVLDPSKLGPIFNHALPGEHHHGEEHDEEHEEGDEGEEGGGDGEEGGGEEGGQEGSEESSGGEGGDQSPEGSDSDDSKTEQSGEDTPDTSDDEDSRSSDSPSNEKTQVGRNKPGEQGIGQGKLEQAKELPPGEKGERRFVVPDSKGGNMRRVESPKGIVQGRAEGQEEGGSIGDVKDGATSAVAGKTSTQQKGLSNTDTKHSIDLMADPEKSKKSEGVPETAKIQGTVDPKRKAT